MIVLKGNPVSPGLAAGTLHLYRPVHFETAESFCNKESLHREKDRYAQVMEQAASEIAAIYAALEHEDPEKAKIFTAHRDILRDPAIQEEILEGIESEFWSGDWAIWKVYAKFIKMIGKARDEMIRERAADFEDVRKRLLRIWHGASETNLSNLAAPVIVAAHDLFPSDTATLDRRKVLAIITETGGATSHSAIIARSYEIPAVLGLPHLLESIRQGMFAAVDALTGEVFLEPDQETKKRIGAKRDSYLAEDAQTKTFLAREPLTADGTRIDIGLNIGSANEEELAGADSTDFVGLFRTEFLYMGRPALPDEDEQFGVYRKVLERYKPRPVTLRTLDIGGDKPLECMELPKEENPFLGKRALRLCFAYPDIFKTQLRAALRSSVYGNLHIMLPMVGSIDDIRGAKQLLEEAKAELDGAGIEYRKDYKLGIMIEIPSIALIADLAAAEVDFASVGTNDLCQYLCAVDRMNPDISSYYQSFHPAMLRLLGEVAGHFAAAGKPLSVCGEMGGNPLAAIVLAGLGIRKLSMGLASVAAVKRTLARFTTAEMEAIAGRARELATAAEIENFLREREKVCTEKQ